MRAHSICILLVNDGTLTDALEAAMLEPIRLEKLAVKVFPAPVAVVALESQHGAPADAGRRGSVLERPFQRRPRHPRLLRPKYGMVQLNPLDAFLYGP